MHIIHSIFLHRVLSHGIFISYRPVVTYSPRWDKYNVVQWAVHDLCDFEAKLGGSRKGV